jgi:hypothetical protein
MTSFSEVLARVIVYTRLLGHLNGNNILIEEQFGFRKNLTNKKVSCEQISDIVNALNDK